MKTIKTAISMPEDLYQAVRTRAGDKPFSTTMCDLIRQALGLEVIPTNTGITETSIYDQLRELTARIEAIEQRGVIPLQDRATGPGAAPGSITEVIPENEPVQPEVIPAVIPANAESALAAPDQPDHHLTTQCSQVNEQVAPAGGDEWVMITDEVRARIVDHLSKLQAAGMSYSKIGSLAGMGKGRFTELHQGKLKKMHRAQYEALMAIN